MHEQHPESDGARDYILGPSDEEASDVFEINGREVLVSRYNAIAVLYHAPSSRRYSHLILNPASESPIRQFSPDHTEIQHCLTIVPPIVSLEADESIRQDYWQFMNGQDVELDEDDIAEREAVLSVKADRLIRETDLDGFLAHLLADS